jgi:hypothetical protein
MPTSLPFVSIVTLSYSQARFISVVLSNQLGIPRDEVTCLRVFGTITHPRLSIGLKCQLFPSSP